MYVIHDCMHTSFCLSARKISKKVHLLDRIGQNLGCGPVSHIFGGGGSDRIN